MYMKFKFILIIIVSSFIITTLPASENRFVIEQQKSGALSLHVKAALIKSEEEQAKLRVETLDGTYSLGRWSQQGDSVEWLFKVERPGKYYILIETACLKSRAGGIVEFKVGSESREFTVPATGGWKDFTFTQLGDSFRLNGGEHKVEVMPVAFEQTLMNLRAVLLVPDNIAPEKVIAERERANSVRAQAYTFYMKGWELEKEKRFSGAVAQYKEALKVDKTYGDAYYRAAITLLNRLDKPTQALDYFERGRPYVHYNDYFYSNYANALGKAERYGERIESYLKAADIILKSGRKPPYWIYYNIGNTYYHNLKEYKEALPYFHLVYEDKEYKPEERDRGLYRVISCHKGLEDVEQYRRFSEIYLTEGLNSEYKGRFYLELGSYYLKEADQPERGREYLTLCIEQSTLAIKEKGEAKSYSIYFSRGSAKRELADLEGAYEDFLKAHELKPDAQYYRLSAANLALELGCLRLVEKRHDRAIQLFRRGLSLKPNSPERFTRYLYIATNHKRYHKVKSDYTFRIAEVITRKSDITFTNSKGETMHYKGEILDEQLEGRHLAIKLFTIMLEALTKGQLTLEFDSFETGGVLTGVIEGYNWEKGIYYYPDMKTLDYNLAPFLVKNRNYYDGYIYYWRAGLFDTVATGGGKPGNYIPYTMNSLPRGHITIPSERTGWQWSFNYLHEFWHTLEGVVPMKPNHGWKKPNLAQARANFPRWKGEGEWSWYLYHLAETIPAFLKEKSKESGLDGYGNINYIHRYPDLYSDEELAAYLDKVKKVPLEQLKRGWDIQVEGDKLWAKQQQEAVKLYEKALEHNPYLFESLKRVAYYRLQQKQYEPALSYYERLAALLPGDYSAHYNMASCANGLGRFEEAFKHYSRSLELKDDNAWAYWGRSSALFRLEKYEEAIADMNKALELEPARAVFYRARGYYLYTLARLRESNELYNKAKADYLQTLKLDPADSTAIKMLESIKKRLGG